LQLNARKCLVYGGIALIWLVHATALTTSGFLSTDIVRGNCVPWGVYSSYVAEKIVSSYIFIIALLLPLLMMVFCYTKIVYKLKHTVCVCKSIFYNGKQFLVSEADDFQKRSRVALQQLVAPLRGASLLQPKLILWRRHYVATSKEWITSSQVVPMSWVSIPSAESATNFV